MQYKAFANLRAEICITKTQAQTAESARAKNERKAELRRIADAKAAAELAAERMAVEAKARETATEMPAECRALVESFLADMDSIVAYENAQLEACVALIEWIDARQAEKRAKRDAKKAKRIRRQKRKASAQKRDMIQANTRANRAAVVAEYASGAADAEPALRMKGGWDCVNTQKQFGTQTTKGWGWAWSYIPVHKRTFENDALELDPDNPGGMRRVSRVQFSVDETRRHADGSAYRFRRVSDSESFRCEGIEVRWTGVPNSKGTGAYQRNGVSTPDGVARNGMCFPLDDSEPEIDSRKTTGANRRIVSVMRTNSKGKRRVYQRAA